MCRRCTRLRRGLVERPPRVTDTAGHPARPGKHGQDRNENQGWKSLPDSPGYHAEPFLRHARPDTLAPLAAAARRETRLKRGAAGRDRRLLRVEARLNAR